MGDLIRFPEQQPPPDAGGNCVLCARLATCPELCEPALEALADERAPS